MSKKSLSEYSNRMAVAETPNPSPPFFTGNYKMAEKMGLQFGLEANACAVEKRRFRWLFKIPEISATGIHTLPPSRAARPNLMFKEMVVRHLIEDVHYPAKPDWKPVPITLYDLHNEKGLIAGIGVAGAAGITSRNLVFQWIREFYRPHAGGGELDLSNDRRFLKTCTLEMLNGCGEIIETWVFEDAWPISSNFQTLDMNDSSVCVVDISLRFARAYVEDGGGEEIIDRDDGRNAPQGRDAQIAFTS